MTSGHVETLALVNTRTLVVSNFIHGGEPLCELSISERENTPGTGHVSTYLTIEETTRLRDACNIALRRMRQ